MLVSGERNDPTGVQLVEMKEQRKLVFYARVGLDHSYGLVRQPGGWGGHALLNCGNSRFLTLYRES